MYISCAHWLYQCNTLADLQGQVLVLDRLIPTFSKLEHLLKALVVDLSLCVFFSHEVVYY